MANTTHMGRTESVKVHPAIVGGLVSLMVAGVIGLVSNIYVMAGLRADVTHLSALVAEDHKIIATASAEVERLKAEMAAIQQVHKP